MIILSLSQVCLLISLYLTIIVLINSKGNKISPRKAILNNLKANGCTNKLVAKYIIDVYNSGIPNTEMISRLTGITGYDTSQISKWFSKIFCFLYILLFYCYIIIIIIII